MRGAGKKARIRAWRLRKISSDLSRACHHFSRAHLITVGVHSRAQQRSSPGNMDFSLRALLCMLPLLISANGGQIESNIKNIVVLMMENRSFDHLLGWLKQDSKAHAGIDGLVEGMSCLKSTRYPELGSLNITREGLDVCQDDPQHTFDPTQEQINNNMMNGFIQTQIDVHQSLANPVSMFDQDKAPIINTLAKEFAVFDSWFSSVPGPTDPNRCFAMAGTSKGIVTNFNGTLYDQQSYFDYLSGYNRTWKGYYQDDLWMLGAFEDLLIPKNSKNVQDMDQFFEDAANGDLPQYSWLQPRMSTFGPNRVANWQHPDASVLEGERLIKDVYEALRKSPAWEQTLFIITYDEHGGFYDHATPPYKGVPAPDDNVNENGFAFDRLGIRIPTIAVSPWIAKNTIVKSTLSPDETPTETSAFESTSIMATANILLGISDAPPLGDRMGWANTFASLVDSEKNVLRDDCPMELPELPPTPEDLWLRQREKPINEHMESQLLFYCEMNHKEDQKSGECSGRPELIINQGLASDWLKIEHDEFQTKLREKERENFSSGSPSIR